MNAVRQAREQYSSLYLVVLQHKASDKNWSSWYATDLIGLAG